MSSIVPEDVQTSDTSSGTLQTSTSSSLTEPSNSLALNRKSKRSSRVPERFRQDREKALAGRSNRDLIRLLIHEEYHAKDTRNLLHTAFDRLELETQRVAEAEARVLEIAQRFRTVNDARIASQQDAARANEELRLYKFQYSNAQQEISRAQDTLKTIEGQRDDAAAAATRARDAARKYRENHLVYVAREEGRRLGYEEGLRHAKYGYAGVGAIGYDDEYSDSTDGVMTRLITREPFNDTSPEDDSVTDDVLSSGSMNLRGLPSANYPEPAARNSSNGRHTTPTAPLSPVGIPLGSSRPVTWPDPQQEDNDTPVIVHNTVPGPHPEPPIPPEGWIPRSDENDYFSMPPAHEFGRPPPTATGTSRVHAPSVQNIAEPSNAPSRHRRRVSSPLSAAESLGSTTFSQFDLVATGPEQEQSPSGRKLSIIPEVSTQGDLTPTVSGRRSRMETTLTNTPALETDYGYSLATDMTLRSPAVAEFAETSKANGFKPTDPRGRDPVQRFADELRYSDPDIVDTWRRSASDSLRSPDHTPRHRPSRLSRPSPLSTGSVFSNNLRSSSQSQSSGIPIAVQSPSTPESYDFDHSHTPGLLSPYSLPQERPLSGTSDDSLTPDESKISLPQAPRSSHSTSSRGQPLGYPSGSQTPRAMSPERDPRDKRRSKSTPREPVSRSQTPYAVAPIPEGINYPDPYKQMPAPAHAPPIGSSLSAGPVGVGSPRSSQVMHNRSLSMHAGATPANMGRSLLSREDKDATLRKMPSVTSSTSGSARSSSYKAYDPSEYVDPAFLASSEDLSAPVAASRSRNAARSGKRVTTR